MLRDAFEDYKSNMDKKLKEIWDDLKKSDGVEVKLKLAIPLLNLIGVNLKTKIDIKKWQRQSMKNTN